MAEQAEQTTQSSDVTQFPPGVLCGVEYAKEPPVELDDNQIKALKSLDQKIAKRDMAAWREEIIRVWEARWFSRGLQHILPAKAGFGWELPGRGTGYNPQDADSRSMFEVNIYSSYSEIITAALTREFPAPRSKPYDQESDADITSAQAADALLEEVVRRANGMQDLMADESRLLWTDGRSMKYTRYVLDGQQFGYKPDVEGVVPEDENKPDQPAPEPGQPQEIAGETPDQNNGGLPLGTHEGNAAAGTSDAGMSAQRQPRGWQVTTALGALEVKVPMKANCIDECDYVRYSEEVSISRAKAMFPKIADKIQATTGGPGGDDIDRLARVNTKLGVMNNFLTSDSAAYDVTITRLFIRPSQLIEIEDEGVRNSLLQQFSETGCKITFVGNEHAETRKASIDDHWSLTFALPGDGAHRLALGTKIIPIQKILNTRAELENDYFIRGVPMTWLENETFSREAIEKQERKPGGFDFFDLPAQAAATGMLGTYIVPEPAIEIPPELAASIQFLILDLSQLLCGAVPALFGGDAGSEGVGDALMQRDQALGRIGLTWRSIKQGYARTATQIVRSIAKNHEDAIKTTGSEALTVEMASLKGNFLCYSEVDENFPETPTQKSNRVMMLLQSALTNPMIMQLIDDPDNAEIIKDAIGLEELTLPVLESRDKQLGEIDILLKSGPAPNPQLAQAQEALAPVQQAAQMGNPEAVAASAQAQQALQQLPQQVSTVEVDDLCDDHATEAATVKSFINSPRGRSLKNGTPEDQAGFQNIRLHLQEHLAAQAKQQSAGAQVPSKPPNVTINVKDLPPTEAAAVLTNGGIPAQPQDFAQKQAQQAMEKQQQAEKNLTPIQ